MLTKAYNLEWMKKLTSDLNNDYTTVYFGKEIGDFFLRHFYKFVYYPQKLM